MSIEVFQVESVSDCEQCHRIASHVWGPAASTPVPQLLVNARYGGIVLLAVEDGDAVGFLFSFPARFRGEWVLWSHETAVLPTHTNRGIGAALKSWQREAAYRAGYEHVVWTFDPLVSRNAYFNLEKLRASIVDHQINVYGADKSDFINNGLETDRFVASWPTMQVDEPQDRPGESCNKPTYTCLCVDPNGEPKLTSTELSFPDDAVIIMQIPSQLWDSPENGDLRARWRGAFRKAAGGLLECGYIPVTYGVHHEIGTYTWRARG